MGVSLGLLESYHQASETILDLSVVIAILRLEPEAPEFAAVIERAPPRRMSAVSYVEAGAVIDGSRDPVASRRLDDLIEEAQIALNGEPGEVRINQWQGLRMTIRTA